uniref:Ribonuclease P protein subunit p29 n=1 Tax=Osmerus mordax TaxID=8014 RepID=C1BL44_OSMMO|nr:Ribonuclease P protein subunit p29 [Osmerus mordax]
MEESIVQDSLPPGQGEVLGIQSVTQTQADKFTNAFLKNSLPGKNQEQIEEYMNHKAVVLEHRKQKTPRIKTKKAKGLNARQRREMKVFQLKPEHHKYLLFMPLHGLWKQYIVDLCNGLKPNSNPQLIQQRLLKADFHGAIMTVVRSKCPSYVGTSGILVQELKHVFKIITKEDRLKVIPKRNSVFAVEINGFVSHIYGSKFELRSSQRSAKKFKVKGTIDL